MGSFLFMSKPLLSSDASHHEIGMASKALASTSGPPAQALPAKFYTSFRPQTIGQGRRGVKSHSSILRMQPSSALLQLYPEVVLAASSGIPNYRRLVVFAGAFEMHLGQLVAWRCNVGMSGQDCIAEQAGVPGTALDGDCRRGYAR